MSSMRLTIIGCSGSYPGPEAPASCYLLEADVGDGDDKRTWRVLLDLGNGSIGALQPNSLDRPPALCHPSGSPRTFRPNH